MAQRPCVGRWFTSRGHKDVHHYRFCLDRLEVDDVRFSTYGDHRDVHPFQLLCRHGNGEGWGRVLHSPSPYPILIYLPVTLPIPNGDEKLNPIPVPDGFGYLRLIPVRALNNFFQ